MRVRLGDDAAADIADTIDTVHVRATMNYRGKVTREIDKKIPLAQVQEGNYSLDFGTSENSLLRLLWKRTGTLFALCPTTLSE